MRRFARRLRSDLFQPGHCCVRACGSQGGWLARNGCASGQYHRPRCGGELITMKEYVDIIVPRGGKSLIARISEEAKVPVIKHLDGICHAI